MNELLIMKIDLDICIVLGEFRKAEPPKTFGIELSSEVIESFASNTLLFDDTAIRVAAETTMSVTV